MGNIDRIYWDTSSLRKAQWPEPTALLERIFYLARALRISIFISEVVELESEAAWLQGVHEAHTKAVQAGARIVDWDRSTWTEIQAQYRVEKTAQMRKWGIESVPVTERSAAYLFKTLTKLDWQFQRTMAAFRDLMIYQFIVAHLSESGGHSGFIVSEDNGLNELLCPQEQDRLRRLGVTLAIGTLGLLWDRLEEMSRAMHSNDDQKRREQQEQLAWTALESKKG